jgi:hypothetical protein
VREPKRTIVLLGLALLAAALLAPASAQAAFGIESFSAEALNADETTDLQAGSRPYEYVVSIEMNKDAEGGPEGTLRQLYVDLPEGLLGDPTALPRCARLDFGFGISPTCPGDTQIGIAKVSLYNGAEPFVLDPAVYNLTPTPGAAATIGFTLNGYLAAQDAALRSSTDFGATVGTPTVPGILLQSVKVTVWGVPAAEGHDPQRYCVNPVDRELPQIIGCSSSLDPTPFLTLPTACGEPLKTTLRVDSLQEPGVVHEATSYSEEGGEPFGMSGCNALEFEPSISAQPTTNRADSPAGLDFDLHQPQNEECVEEGEEVDCGLATAALKDTTVTLPAGLNVNPASAGGLGACTEAEIGYQPWEGKVRFDESPQSCPDAAKLGTLEVIAPPVDHPLQGSVYLAKPFENPFGSLLALYLAVEDPQTGIVAKLAGKVTPDPSTGQLTTTVEENPQLPLEDVKLHLFGGARGALETPIACGTHTTTSTLVPWSAPEGETVHPTDSFQIDQPAQGGPCPASEAEAPNDPSFEAGTVSPVAGAFSPFVLRLTRQPGSQRLERIDTVLPPGLTGRLAGTSICPEAQIATAIARSNPGDGALEQDNPSCPASSEIGTATVGAGAGPSPYYVTGHAYLAGPYKGAPASIAFITPAIAGPFDLGAVVVRAPLHLDPETAQITVRSDPIPQLLHGIPLDVRSVAVHVSRPDFSLNPTSCEAMAVNGTATSPLGNAAPLSNRFQVGECARLAFKPKLALRLKGKTRRGGNPALKATLTMPPGGANIASISVALPRSEFLDQAHIRTVCTRVQFGAGAGGGEQCPPGSIYGHVTATSPLVDYALQGPVFLRSSDHELPDLVPVVKGPDYQPIAVAQVGRVDSVKGGIRNSFESFPDVAISRVVLSMQGGKKGLLENSTNICAKPYRATVKYTAHNGKRTEAHPKLINPKCKGKAKRRAHRRASGHGKR